LVRADWASDSDETDAGQADINWEALDLKELGENHGPPRATLDMRAMEALGINDRYPLWDTSEEQEARFTGTARRASLQDYEAVEESRDQDFSAKAPNTEGLPRTKGEMRSKNATGSGTASDSKGEVKSKNATCSGFVSDEKIVTDLPENVHQELKEQAQKKQHSGAIANHEFCKQKNNNTFNTRAPWRTTSFEKRKMFCNSRAPSRTASFARTARAPSRTASRARLGSGAFANHGSGRASLGRRREPRVKSVVSGAFANRGATSWLGSLARRWAAKRGLKESQRSRQATWRPMSERRGRTQPCGLLKVGVPVRPRLGRGLSGEAGFGIAGGT
jgi:hypothetical protein